MMLALELLCLVRCLVSFSPTYILPKGAAMNPTQTTTRNLRRGFSIVEVMIAMTVVTIVCFSTLTILLSSQVSATRAMKHQQAQFYVEDVINCFRVAKDPDDFNNLVAGVFNEADASVDATNNTVTLKNGYVITYEIKDNSTIEVNVSEDGKQVVPPATYTKVLSTTP